MNESFSIEHQKHPTHERYGEKGKRLIKQNCVTTMSFTFNANYDIDSFGFDYKLANDYLNKNL